jgi:hypothetical protein
VKYNHPNSENNASTSDTSQSENSDEEDDNIPLNIPKRKYTKEQWKKEETEAPLPVAGQN